MHYWIFSGGGALLTFVPVAVTVGTARVVNNCGFPVYYASVGHVRNASMQEVRGSYSESYTKPGVGISIKLSPSMNGYPLVKVLAMPLTTTLPTSALPSAVISLT